MGYTVWLQLAVTGLCGSFGFMATPSFKKPGHHDPNRPVLKHGPRSRVFSVWVAAWGNRLVVRYLASRDVYRLVPSLRPRTQGSIARAARQGQ